MITEIWTRGAFRQNIISHSFFHVLSLLTFSTPRVQIESSFHILFVVTSARPYLSSFHVLFVTVRWTRVQNSPLSSRTFFGILTMDAQRVQMYCHANANFFIQ
jgi:hypothetical protein